MHRERSAESLSLIILPQVHLRKPCHNFYCRGDPRHRGSINPSGSECLHLYQPFKNLSTFCPFTVSHVRTRPGSPQRSYALPYGPGTPFANLWFIIFEFGHACACYWAPVRMHSILAPPDRGPLSQSPSILQCTQKMLILAFGVSSDPGPWRPSYFRRLWGGVCM